MNFPPACWPAIPAASPSWRPSRGAISTAMRRCSGALGLNGYLAAGISTDHETTSGRRGAGEACQRACTSWLREGSVSKDLEALIPIITERNSPFIALCTDDPGNPLDIAEHGPSRPHDPQPRSRAGSKSRWRSKPRGELSAARIFGLTDRGLVARASALIWWCSIPLESCRAQMVFSAGREVSDETFLPPGAR